MTSCNEGDTYHLNKVVILIVTVKGNKSRFEKNISIWGFFSALKKQGMIIIRWESSSRVTAHHKEIG